MALSLKKVSSQPVLPLNYSNIKSRGGEQCSPRTSLTSKKPLVLKEVSGPLELPSIYTGYKPEVITQIAPFSVIKFSPSPSPSPSPTKTFTGVQLL